MLATLRTLSFWLGLGGFVLSVVGHKLPVVVLAPADLALLFALRWAARREGRHEGLTAAYDLTKAEATGQLIRRRPL